MKAFNDWPWCATMTLQPLRYTIIFLFYCSSAAAQEVGFFGEGGSYIGLTHSAGEVAGSVVEFDTDGMLIQEPVHGSISSDGSSMHLVFGHDRAASNASASYASTVNNSFNEWTLVGSSNDGSRAYPALSDLGVRSDEVGEAFVRALENAGVVDANGYVDFSKEVNSEYLSSALSSEKNEPLSFVPIGDYSFSLYSSALACRAAQSAGYNIVDLSCELGHAKSVAVIAPQSQAAFYKLLSEEFSNTGFYSSPLNTEQSIVATSIDTLVNMGKSTDWKFKLAAMDFGEAQALTAPVLKNRHPFLKFSSPPDTLFHDIFHDILSADEMNNEVANALQLQAETEQGCGYLRVDNEPVIVCLNHNEEFGMGARPFFILSVLVLDISINPLDDIVDVVAGTEFGIKYGNRDLEPKGTQFKSVNFENQSEALAVSNAMDRFRYVLKSKYPNLEVR